MKTQPHTIRTFRAPDSRTALHMVKAAFGGSAVILSTRQVGSGLFGRPEIEVTAALSDEVETEAEKIEAKKPSNHSVEITEELRSLRHYVEETRRTMVDMNHRPTAREEGNENARSAASTLTRKLGKLGFDAEIAEGLLEEVIAEGVSAKPDAIFNALRDKITSRFQIGTAPWQRASKKASQRIMALIGPTGVGKTTTVAKIAARAILEGRMKVALITIDTFRIGACEQLQRYGEIMRVPTHVAGNAQELRQAIARSAACDLILIDSAGRFPQDEMFKQAQLLNTIAGIELQLVLSAATGAQELDAVSRRYEALVPSGTPRENGNGASMQLIFTKLDEAAGPGGIMSVAPRPVSCIANGQRVPEDLHSMNEKSLTDLVLGTWKGTTRSEQMISRDAAAEPAFVQAR